MEIKEITALQKEFFASGKTLDIGYRAECLKKLLTAVTSRSSDIATALHADLNKSETEAFMTEIGLVVSDIGYMLKHLKRWAKPVKVKTPIMHFRATSRIIPEPYGCALIMAPWNYPFLLSMQPLCAAVAAGNTVLLKPSAYAPATSALLAELTAQCFAPGHVTVVEGGRKENALLLDEKFDYIFFTGSVSVGRLVMEKAAAHLTPVTLELGGKSPCIVDGTVDMELAARRIIFGKLINAGQTCVAPDYVMIKKGFENDFVSQASKAVERFMNGDFADFPHIVNDKHYDRAVRLLDGQNIVYGGTTNKATRFIEPTILLSPTPDSPVMSEEIFAPILPVLTYSTDDELVSFVTSRPKPLALYLFTSDKRFERRILSTVSFGGGCVNDTIMHLASHGLPFGGVGDSGMGSYHGKKSFDTFTHYKSVLKKSLFPDLTMRYRPYTEKKRDTIKKFLK